MTDESMRETSAPSMEMVTKFISVDQFLEPWRSQLHKVCEASGAESYQVKKDSRLHSAAVKLIRIAYGPEETTQPERNEAVEEADWLLQVLAPGDIGDEEAMALIKDEFWFTLAGRTLFQTLEFSLGEAFCDLEEAAGRLGIPKARLYHWVATKRVPSYVSEDDGYGRRKFRVRLDQVERVLADGEERAG